MKNFTVRIGLALLFGMIFSATMFVFNPSEASADYCGDKYLHWYQEPDRVRCRAEQNTGIGGGDANPGEFYIHNQTSRTVWVAYSYFVPRDPNSSCLKGVGISCGDRWATRGWQSLSPGSKSRILKNNQNRYIYVYAVDDTGGTWSGKYQKWVVDSKFKGSEYGVNPSSQGAYKVGFFEVNVGNSPRYTLNLN